MSGVDSVHNSIHWPLQRVRLRIAVSLNDAIKYFLTSVHSLLEVLLSYIGAGKLELETGRQYSNRLNVVAQKELQVCCYIRPAGTKYTFSSPFTLHYRYGASARAAAAISGSHLSPFASSFSLLYRSSSLVSVAYSAFGPKSC